MMSRNDDSFRQKTKVRKGEALRAVGHWVRKFLVYIFVSHPLKGLHEPCVSVCEMRRGKCRWSCG